MTWKIFLQSLLTAAVSGAATAVATKYTGGDNKAIGGAAAAGAIIGIANLLKQSPNTTSAPSNTSTDSSKL